MPNVHPTAFVHPSALLYGEITLGEGSSVWPHAVMRAEAQRIEIGRVTNIQDFVMLHVGFDHPTLIGDFCSITHHATVHGATVEDCCLIGIGAVIMDGAVIGRGSIVAGGAVVPEGTVFPPASVIAGVPAKLRGERDSSRENRLNAWQYQRNAEYYQRGQHRAWDGPDYAAWLTAKRAEVERDGDR